METKKLFEERRSVNSFNPDKKFDRETLKDIINMATLAPSAFNLQPWRIIVAESDDAKDKLMKLAFNQPKVKEAAYTLIIVGNKDGWKETNPVWEEMLHSVGSNTEMVNGAKQSAAFLYGSDEIRSLKFAESNASLLAMAIMIAAKEYGIDSHPMSGMDFDGIHKEFGLAENETVVMLVTLGYHDETKDLYPRRPRRGFEEIASVI
ncbi:MAG: nitroreductase family protein [Bacteroidales bacterium]|nr:nitroreductase family protein [Bacteroidales bacterium]